MGARDQASTRPSDSGKRFAARWGRGYAVVVEFIEPAHWFIAGQALAADRPRSYHGYVSISDETNTKAEKARYIAAAAEHSYVHAADLRASAYGDSRRMQ